MTLSIQVYGRHREKHPDQAREFCEGLSSLTGT